MTPQNPDPASAHRFAPTQVRRLERSGLTLLARENHDAAVATADVWIGVGSADEPPEIGGVSHFLEHMMFKGTEKYSPGQIEREIENRGGLCNAGTSYDFTHYYITMPSENIDHGIDALAEMMVGSVIDPTEFEKERIVILEEWRRKQDTPGAMLHEDAYEEIFEAGPYHRPVIGTQETIKAITRDQMMDYYQRHYTPEKMALVVTGDVDVDHVAALADARFAGIGRRYNPLVTTPEAQAIGRGKVHHREKATGGQLYLAMGAALAARPSVDDLVPLDVAQFILGQGRASILFQELKEKRRLASTISANFGAHRDNALLMVMATCSPANKAELADAIRAEIAGFLARPIEDAQLTRARRLLASAHLHSFETSGGAAGEVGYYHMLTGDPAFLDTYLDRLAAATGDQIREALRRQLDGNPLNLITVGPQQ